jgi:phenylalanyl-tRNA synthetase beta chain
VRIVHPWLRELVDVPADVELTARELSLRGFEVAEIENGPVPVIDFEITANRPDCLSHVGLAREASVIWGVPLQMPDLAMPMPGAAVPLDVRIDDADLCPRYCAQVFEVRVGPSPAWLAQRLEAAGIRSINSVVDVTNYVMLEMGQPMHAFDLDRVAGRMLIIRRAIPGEGLRTLDGVDRALEDDMLVIADAERASAIGGVMGGAESEIGSATRLIALESAYFVPPSVRRTSKKLGLKTEASTRFERGGDINAPPVGVARAAVLFDRIGAGRPLGALIDRYPVPRSPGRIYLRASRIARVLGQEVPPEDVPRFLEPLGFGVAPTVPQAQGRPEGGRANGREAEPGWMVTVPTWRVDVVREVDLIEEVGRHFGFDRLPVTFPPLDAPQAPPDRRIGRDRLIRRVLTATGFSEAMTFAFMERDAALPFSENGAEPAAIANPLSEKYAVLRPSLLPGLVDAAVHNRRRERRDVQLFETGSRFTAEGEGRAAALVWSGAATPAHWSAPARPVDFFDVKGVAEQLTRALGVETDCVPAVRPYLVSGRSADLIAHDDGRTRHVGVVGQIAPAIAAARGFPPLEEMYAVEIDLNALGDPAPSDDLKAQSLPRFPSIVRDISIIVDEVLPAATVRGTIRSTAPPTLVSIAEFDRYHGKGVPDGRVSLSLRLTFRASDRTLTDQEADEATNRIVGALRTAHGAERR